jgi:hypothetical protein
MPMLVFIHAVMSRKLLRQNAQLCFPVNTLLPLHKLNCILVVCLEIAYTKYSVMPLCEHIIAR